MATATTFQLIRETMVTKVKALTPAIQAVDKFDRHKLQYRGIPLKDWALTNHSNSGILRRFEIRADGASTNLGVLDYSARRMEQFATLVMAYPVQPGLYGITDVGDGSGTTDDDVYIEDVMTSDAKQVHDCLHGGGNYLAGQELTEVELLPHDMADPRVWFLELRLRVIFFQAMSLP